MAGDIVWILKENMQNIRTPMNIYHMMLIDTTINNLKNLKLHIRDIVNSSELNISENTIHVSHFTKTKHK